MEPRQPPPNHPFSQRNASPLFSRSPFPPSTSAPPQGGFAPTSHPPSGPPPPPNGPAYQDHPSHHQRRPSDPHFFPQSRPAYANEPAPHPPPQGQARHPSASGVQRSMPPPNSPPQHNNGPNNHQMGYSLPPPRPPPVSVNNQTGFANGRELPAINSMTRSGSTNSSMSISSMLGGPAPGRDPGAPPQYQPQQPPPTSGPMSAGPNYASPVHASPRMHPGEYQQYRRPQTPDHQRPYDVRADSRDPRNSAVASPQGMYPTPEVQRYGTPQEYRRGPPPMNEPGREPGRMHQGPPRPSSQPKMYNNMPPGRQMEPGRPGPPPHDPMYQRREEPPPSGEYNPERPIRVSNYEDARYMAERERMEREQHEREMQFRDRHERDRQEMEFRDREQRRGMERRNYERQEMERRELERRERNSELGRPPPGHPDYGHGGGPPRGPPGPPGPSYGRQPDPREEGWQRHQYEQSRPYDPAGHPPPRHPDYPPSTGPPYGPHPGPYQGQHPMDHAPPTSHPSQTPAVMAPGERGPSHPHAQPFDSPERQRHAAPHHHHQQGPPPHRNPADEQPPRPSVAYSAGPGGLMYDSPRNRAPAPEGLTPTAQRDQPRSLLTVQEINRKGRLSPLPQAVQGAQSQMQGPAGEPGIKSEFGRMFSGIGSGVGSLSSPVAGGAQLPFTASGLARKDDSDGTPVEDRTDANGNKMVREGSKNKRRSKIKDEDIMRAVEDGRQTPVGGRGKRPKTNAHGHHHHHQ